MMVMTPRGSPELDFVADLEARAPSDAFWHHELGFVLKGYGHSFETFNC
jgi:hypothetical protein